MCPVDKHQTHNNQGPTCSNTYSSKQSGTHCTLSLYKISYIHFDKHIIHDKDSQFNLIQIHDQFRILISLNYSSIMLYLNTEVVIKYMCIIVYGKNILHLPTLIENEQNSKAIKSIIS